MRSLRGQTSQNAFLIVVVLTLFLAACSSDSSPSSENMSSSNTSEESISGSVSVSGSSTVEPISTRVKETYNDTVSGDVEITVDGGHVILLFKPFIALRRLGVVSGRVPYDVPGHVHVGQSLPFVRRERSDVEVGKSVLDVQG